MAVDFKGIEDLLGRIKKRPGATIAMMVFALVIVAGGAWLVSYMQEKGKEFASEGNEASPALPRPAPRPQSTGDPHTYQFTMLGRRFSGRSTNPFEEAQGYRARVEFCERHGIENIFVTVTCYLTLIPTANLTISNSENITTATYEDGSVATICCMHVGDGPVAALFRVRLPRGTMTRQTYRRGDVVHILLNIPGADPTHTLDAINFSPGEGAPTVLFPLRGNLTDRIFSAAFVNAHRGDPEMEQLIQDTIHLRDGLIAREAANQGFTYPQ